MSELKHTPGPWKAVQGHRGAELSWFLVKGEDQDGIYIGSEADTKLIAAAPELLTKYKALEKERDQLLVLLRNVVKTVDELGPVHMTRYAASQILKAAQGRHYERTS